MTDKQLKELKVFLNDGIYAESKDTDSDISKILSELKSLGLIKKKLNSPTLEIIDLISLEKLIEIKSLSDFKKWYSEKDKSITKNFNNYGVNNGVQSLDSNFNKSPIKKKVIAEPNNNPEIKSSVQKFLSNSWVISIGILIIEEITLGKIYKLICKLF